MVLATVLVVAAAAGGAWWWWDQQRAAVRAASVYAGEVALALSEGRLPPDVTAADRDAAQVALDRVLEGMGALEHRVQVGDVDLDDGNSVGLVTFVHAWSIQADRDPWTYETTMPIERSGDSWRGEWGSGVVVAGLADDERVRAVRLAAERADVLGDGGAPLVEARDVVRLGIDRSTVPDAAEASRSAAQLATLVGIDTDPYVSRVADSGPRAFVEAITYRDDADELQGAVAELGGIPGAVTVDSSLPLAPTSTFARAILGTAGQATAEIIETSQGRVRAGDLVGLSGLQATHDDSLAGQPGYLVEAVDLDTEEARSLHEVPAQDGTALQLSLSTSHQLAAETALQDIEPASAIVAIRPSDGHVLAVASGPGSEGYSTATLGQYAPGLGCTKVLGQVPTTCPRTLVHPTLTGGNPASLVSTAVTAEGVEVLTTAGVRVEEGGGLFYEQATLGACLLTSATAGSSAGAVGERGPSPPRRWPALPA